MSHAVNLLAVLSLSAACGGGIATPARTVVVLGSSTAAGSGVSATGNTWVARVQTAARAACPDVTLVNLAVAGYTTAQALPAGAARPQGRPASDPAANLDAALARRPVLVLIQFPSNDAAQNYPIDETLANHRTLRDGVRAAGALDVIIGPFPRAFQDTDQVAAMVALRDLLPAVGAPRYVALWSDLAESDNRVLPIDAAGDGIHLNDAGHAIVAKRVLESTGWRAICPAP